VRCRNKKYLMIYVAIICLSNFFILPGYGITIPNTKFCFDFVPVSAIPENGFLKVAPADLWEETKSYGWLKETVTGVSRKPPDKFRQNKLEYSFHEGEGSNTFRVRVASGKYTCWIVSGDLEYIPPAYALTVNGKKVLTEKDTTFFLPKIGNWTFSAEAKNGVLDFQFEGMPCYVINALVIARNDVWDEVSSIVNQKKKEFISGPEEQLKEWIFKKHVSEPLSFEPANQDRKNGFIVFPWESYRPIYPETVPSYLDVQRKIWSFATPGEYEPVTFGIYPLRKGIEIVSADVSDAISRNSQIEKHCFTLRIAKYRPRRTQWIGRTEYEFAAEFLEKFKPPVLLSETTLFWIVAKIPPDCKPDNYNGKVSIKTSEGRIVNVPFQITVLPFSLPDQPKQVFGMYYLNPLYVPYSYPERLNLYEKRGLLKRAKQQFERDINDMKEHGISSICDPYFALRVMKKNGDILYKLPVDEIRYAARNSVISRPFFSIIPKVEDICAITGDTGISTTKNVREIPPAFSDKFNEIYVSAIAFIQKFIRDEKLPENYFYVIDEPNEPVRKEIGKRLCKLVHQVPGAKTFVTGIVDENYLDHEFVKLIDVINFTGPESVPEDKNLCKGNWFYDNNLTASSGDYLSARFITGFGFWFSNLEGLAPWRYIAQQGSLDTDLDGKMTDFFMVYPSLEENIPTLRWENWREGFDDCRYLTLLEQKIQEGKQSNDPEIQKIVKEAEKDLTSIESLCPSLKQFASPSFDKLAWMSKYYKGIRWMVANNIMKINTVLSKKQKTISRYVKLQKDDFIIKPIAYRDVKEPVINEKFLVAASAKDIVIDGEFSEECWKKAEKVNLVNRHDGSLPRKATEVMVCADNDALYVGFKNYEPSMDGIVAKYSQNEEPVWDDDCVEVFIGEDVGCQDFYHFMVNSNGAITDAFYPSGEFRKKWNAKDVQAGVKKFSDCWQVEIRIPFEEIGLKGKNQIAANFCREEKQLHEDTCWQTKGKGFASSSEFGKLKLNTDGCCLSKIYLKELKLGTNQIDAELTHTGKKDIEIKLVTRLIDSEGKIQSLDEKILKMNPGTSKSVVCPFSIRDTSDNELQIEIYDRSQSTLLEHFGKIIKCSDVFTLVPETYYVIPGIDVLWIRCHLGIDREFLTSGKIGCYVTGHKDNEIYGSREISIKEIQGENFIIGLNPKNLEKGLFTFTLWVKTSESFLKKSIDFFVLDGLK